MLSAQFLQSQAVMLQKEVDTLAEITRLHGRSPGLEGIGERLQHMVEQWRCIGWQAMETQNFAGYDEGWRRYMRVGREYMRELM